jgi:hypothetical protein
MTYEIITHTTDGDKIMIRYGMDMTTQEFIQYIKTQLYDRCYGTTTVCRVFNNKKKGKQYKVF